MVEKKRRIQILFQNLQYKLLINQKKTNQQPKKNKFNKIHNKLKTKLNRFNKFKKLKKLNNKIKFNLILNNKMFNKNNKFNKNKFNK